MTEPVEGKAPVQYILVRADLPVDDAVVQFGHACGESIIVAPIDRRNILRVLFVENEQELLEFGTKLLELEFPVVLVREPDEPYNGQATALGIAPLTERVAKLKKLFFKLRCATWSKV